MADCNSLESLMTALTNEVSSLKTKVANLEADRNNYATKNELQSAIEGVKRLIESLISELRRSFEAAINGLNELLRTLLGRNSADLEQRVKNLEIKVSGIESVIDSLMRTIQAVRNRLEKLESQIFKRLEALENIQGQILQDIKNIYNILTKLKKDFDSFAAWVRFEFFRVWFEITKLNVAVLALSFLLLLKDKIDKLLSLIGKVQELFKLINQLKRSPSRGLPGRNGRDGKNGKDAPKLLPPKGGRDGKDAPKLLPPKGGSNGRDGKDGKNGKDLTMEYSTISVTVFDKCQNGQPVFTLQSLKVLKGLEAERSQEFLEIAKIRGAECTSAEPEPEGELFGAIAIDTVDKKFLIPSSAQKIVIEFSNIKSYISTRFSGLYPKYKDSLGTVSFIIDEAQQPDIFLQYKKIILDIPKAYKNNTKYGYIYLNDCKAIVSFWRVK